MNNDLDLLLAPVSGSAPAGINVEYEQVYEDIRQARESDPDYLPQDEWSTTLRKADWPKVIRLSSQVLRDSSKDMQVACWLVEGLAQQNGIAGAARGFYFLARFIEGYWESGWPENSEDNMAIRHAIFSRLDRQLAQMLVTRPLLEKPESSLEYWQKVLAHEHLMTLKEASDEEEDDDYTMENYQRWVSQLSPEKIAALDADLHQLDDGLHHFIASYQHVGRLEHAAMPHMCQILEELQALTGRLYKHVAPVTDDADIDDIMQQNVLAASGEENRAVPLAGSVASQKMSRDLAITQMLTIAHFFRQTEPSSPVPFLMERAARWANMTLTEWLEEMLRDDGTLQTIHNVLTGPEKE